MTTPRALIAEDEPVLAEGLRRLLNQLWPDLTVSHTVGDGQHACALALQTLPDVLFLDIHMPVLDGLTAAERVIESWPPERALPLIVFVTAFDHHAVAAFERAAVDYVLKPVRRDRLAMTCLRLQQRLAQLAHHAEGGEQGNGDDQALVTSLHALRATPQAAAAPLRILQAAAGSSVYLIPVDDILYLEAADKYVRVVTAQHDPQAPDKLIRTPLRDLLAQLDPALFWQIHRSVVVHARAIERVSRQDHRMRVHLRDHPATLEVSRLYAHRFKAM